MNETDLPTERAEAGQDPRVPQTDVDQGWTGGDPVAPGEGASSAVGVTGGPPAGHRRVAGVEALRSRRSFEAVRRSATRGRAGPLTVHFLEEASWSRPKVAYAISRRTGSAVVRNRLRRRLRAIMSAQAQSIPVGAYVIRTGPDGTRLGFDELKVAMSRALERATSGRATGTAATGVGG
jgi:ribonuclease P protein component